MPFVPPSEDAHAVSTTEGMIQSRLGEANALIPLPTPSLDPLASSQHKLHDLIAHKRRLRAMRLQQWQRPETNCVGLSSAPGQSSLVRNREKAAATTSASARMAYELQVHRSTPVQLHNASSLPAHDRPAPLPAALELLENSPVRTAWHATFPVSSSSAAATAGPSVVVAAAAPPPVAAAPPGSARPSPSSPVSHAAIVGPTPTCSPQKLESPDVSSSQTTSLLLSPSPYALGRDLDANETVGGSASSNNNISNNSNNNRNNSSDDIANNNGKSSSTSRNLGNALRIAEHDLLDTSQRWYPPPHAMEGHHPERHFRRRAHPQRLRGTANLEGLGQASESVWSYEQVRSKHRPHGLEPTAEEMHRLIISKRPEVGREMPPHIDQIEVAHRALVSSPPRSALNRSLPSSEGAKVAARRVQVASFEEGSWDTPSHLAFNHPTVHATDFRKWTSVGEHIDERGHIQAACWGGERMARHLIEGCSAEEALAVLQTFVNHLLEVPKELLLQVARSLAALARTLEAGAADGEAQHGRSQSLHAAAFSCLDAATAKARDFSSVEALVQLIEAPSNLSFPAWHLLDRALASLYARLSHDALTVGEARRAGEAILWQVHHFEVNHCSSNNNDSNGSNGSSSSNNNDSNTNSNTHNNDNDHNDRIGPDVIADFVEPKLGPAGRRAVVQIISVLEGAAHPGLSNLDRLRPVLNKLTQAKDSPNAFGGTACRPCRGGTGIDRPFVRH